MTYTLTQQGQWKLAIIQDLVDFIMPLTPRTHESFGRSLYSVWDCGTLCLNCCVTFFKYIFLCLKVSLLKDIFYSAVGTLAIMCYTNVLLTYLHRPSTRFFQYCTHSCVFVFHWTSHAIVFISCLTPILHLFFTWHLVLCPRVDFIAELFLWCCVSVWCVLCGCGLA